MIEAHQSKMPPKGTGRPNAFQTLDAEKVVGYVTPYIPKHWRIWECASGQGRIVNALRHHGYDVVATDIETGFDFTDKLIPIPDCDMLLTNPPYDIKDKWLQRCYDIGKPFAMLLPITALGEQERVRMFSQHGIQLIMPPDRVEFITPNGTEGGGWFYTAWFCHGLDLPSQITFAESA
jgi:hypothetical protein